MNVSGIKIQKLTNRRAKKGQKRMLATAKKEGKRANVVGVVLVLFLAIVCIGALQHFIFASSPVGSNPRYTVLGRLEMWDGLRQEGLNHQAEEVLWQRRKAEFKSQPEIYNTARPRSQYCNCTKRIKAPIKNI